ncbi:hypothetical protein [Calorimonas adulescens]|uniref:Uncharacterized protein n=1 Tax=Calorimonas adulescens TaxID=2606906 RepID=A0A5D8QAQ3_9THEO|nr:hypothetical protein [Calorimonas adulescens]TZE81835.1 hypothetical protein FWJ32_07605 [Calorimonas adulescens]
MSRLEQNRKNKYIFRRLFFYTVLVSVCTFLSLIVVDYYFYKNIDGTETIHIINVFRANDGFNFILFGREIFHIPVTR